MALSPIINWVKYLRFYNVAHMYFQWAIYKYWAETFSYAMVYAVNLPPLPTSEITYLVPDFELDMASSSSWISSCRHWGANQKNAISAPISIHFIK